MNSRAYRKATSFVDYGGQRFRLTTRFKADLSIKISIGPTLSASDTQLVRTVEGVTPMTLSELFQLQAAIAQQENAALAAESQ